MPGKFQRLREAIRREDGKQAERECHTFKGILLNLSAPRAAASARELENLARKRQFGSMRSGLTELESEVQMLLALIDERSGEFQA
jgi:HPt (histidine-containing phosphotransfer) domain-containing protein